MLEHTMRGIVLIAACAAAASAQTPAPKTSFTADLGFVSASGNTKLSTLNVADKIVHTRGVWTLTQSATYVYGKTDAVESANQLRVSVRAEYALRPRLGLFAGASYARNRFAGFDARTNEMVGVRWAALAAKRDSLDLDAGGALTQQSNVAGTSQSYPAARVAGSYKHSFSKAASFEQRVDYLPNLQSGGDYRLNTESSLVAPISAHIAVRVSYRIQYVSDPPAGFGTTDRLLTTGVQVSF